ncbi:MAG: hypothetical protein KHZ58_00375 [Hungatella hathewayi]|nr:hypothetical protein [Hungatella hathewayi]
MKRLFRIFGRDVLVLLFFGGVIIYTSFSNFVISLKPAVSFVDMLEGVKVEAGDRVAGNVQYCFDYFASQSSYTRYKDGSRSGDRKSGNYYLIPAGDEGFIGLKSREADTAALNKLTKESFEYLAGGAEPTTVIFMQGAVHPLEAELTGYYNEYLESLGFTKEEIKAMGAPLVIEYTSFRAAQVIFGIGIILILLAIWILVRRYKRDLNGSGLPKAEDLPEM